MQCAQLLLVQPAAVGYGALPRPAVANQILPPIHAANRRRRRRTTTNRNGEPTAVLLRRSVLGTRAGGEGSGRGEGGSGRGAARARPLRPGAPREGSLLPLQGE